MRLMIEEIASWENLTAAYDEARRRKKNSAAACAFHLDWAQGLADIRARILAGTWRPLPCAEFEVRNYTKRRHVEAPAFCDRIVHHAIVRVIEPVCERRFIFDSYSCRIGKGNHAAASRAEAILRRMMPCYVLQCDISKFFPSVDHGAAEAIIRRLIRDPAAADLICRAALPEGRDKGLPIGALTSQLLANVYMDTFDHFVKDAVGVRKYLRYADDFLIFDADKYYLADVKAMCAEWLRNELKLSLNPKSGIYHGSQGVDFCGYRIWATHRKPRKRVVKGYREKFRAARNAGDGERLGRVINSFLGYMKHCAGWRTSLSAVVDTEGFKL